MDWHFPRMLRSKESTPEPPMQITPIVLARTRYEYKEINLSMESLTLDEQGPGGRPGLQEIAQRWSDKGWETVAYIPAKSAGYADCILVKRVKKENPFNPNTDPEMWTVWNKEHNANESS